MNNLDNFDSLTRDILDMSVFSDHEHHLPDEHFRQPVTLTSLLAQSYVGWLGYTPGDTPESRAAYLGHVRHNTYYVWFERGLLAAHGLDGPIKADNWNVVSDTVTAAHAANPDLHIDLLLRAGYERLILDTYWNPGDDDGHPDLFAPTFRIDKFMYGHHADAADKDGFNPWKSYGFTGKTLDEYVEFMRAYIRQRHDAGRVVAFKNAEAYRRPITFAADDRAAALDAFGKPRAALSDAQWMLFGNYIFHRCCELAAELDVPFQLHSGLALIGGSDPAHLIPILEKYPQTRFVLFHAGYPWIHTIAGLAHNYTNACPSMTWMPTISSTAAVRALNEFLDVAQSARTITWGSDCWVSEESVGAVMAWRWVVARTLADRIDMGLLRIRDAGKLAEGLMFANNRYMYPKAVPAT